MMGDVAELSNENEFNIHVIGTSEILKVELFAGKNLIAVNQKISELSNKVQIWWTGARTVFRRRNLDWSGKIKIKNGKLRSATGIGFDLPGEGLKDVDENMVEFISTTAGDYDGVVLDIDGDENTEIIFKSDIIDIKTSLKELETPLVKELGAVEKRIEIFRLIKDEYPRTLQWKIKLNGIPEKRTPYYVRVTQLDGEKAWSSPIFISKK